MQDDDSKKWWHWRPTERIDPLGSGALYDVVRAQFTRRAPDATDADVELALKLVQWLEAIIAMYGSAPGMRATWEAAHRAFGKVSASTEGKQASQAHAVRVCHAAIERGNAFGLRSDLGCLDPAFKSLSDDEIERELRRADGRPGSPGGVALAIRLAEMCGALGETRSADSEARRNRWSEAARKWR